MFVAALKKLEFIIKCMSVLRSFFNTLIYLTILLFNIFTVRKFYFRTVKNAFVATVSPRIWRPQSARRSVTQEKTVEEADHSPFTKRVSSKWH